MNVAEVNGGGTVSSAEAGLDQEAEGYNNNNGATSPDHTDKSRYRLLIGIFEKINMIFLVLFVCYLSWSIPSHYGLFSSAQGTTANGSLSYNYSGKFEDTNFTAFNDSRTLPTTHIPNLTDLAYHTNVVLPSHRKQSKKRRKKNRNRNRHAGSSKKNSSTSDTKDSRIRKEGATAKDCLDCKIRKRKGRNKFGVPSVYSQISLSTLRKILERVADQTLSGARSGGGTIVGLDDVRPTVTSGVLRKNRGRQKNNPMTNYGSPDGSHNEPSWFNMAGYLDSDISPTQPRDDLSPWSDWSACSTTCGTGQQERMRRCGSACKEVESMACIMPSCGGDGDEADSSTITEFYRWEKEGFVPPLEPPKDDYLDPEVDTCEKWSTCNKDSAHAFIDRSNLPACPCRYTLQLVKTKKVLDEKLKKEFTWVDVSGHDVIAYKPGAVYCIRSLLAPGATTLAVQQCCYDDSYSLVTRGKSAGTPNLISPDISPELHYKVDLLPWVICKGDWTRYNQVLPPNNQLECGQNPSDDTYQRQIEEVNVY